MEMTVRSGWAVRVGVNCESVAMGKGRDGER